MADELTLYYMLQTEQQRTKLFCGNIVSVSLPVWLYNLLSAVLTDVHPLKSADISLQIRTSHDVWWSPGRNHKVFLVSSQADCLTPNWTFPTTWPFTALQPPDGSSLTFVNVNWTNWKTETMFHPWPLGVNANRSITDRVTEIERAENMYGRKKKRRWLYF